LGGAIALAGVVLATLAAPQVEPSPAGSALPEPADLAPRGDAAARGYPVEAPPRRTAPPPESS
jgi:hypothetical protein